VALPAGRAEAVPEGTLLAVSREGLDVACGGDSTLRLRKVQPESRGPVSGFDFANGAKLRPGAILGPGDGVEPASRPSEPKD
jgi:methionyl-tRNA formyltransferase